MARGKAHSPELRAQVLAALMAGQGVSEVAKQYGLDKGLVSRWRSLQPVATKTDPDLEDLIGEYLRETLITLAVQQRHFRDPEWLAQQSASELGVLHGISVDKAIRILGAAERAGEPTDAA